MCGSKKVDEDQAIQHQNFITVPIIWVVQMQGQAGIALLRVCRTVELVNLKYFGRGFAGMSKDVITGLNINKGGSDPPLKPDEEYPEWLWKLATPDKTLGELRRTDADSLTYEDLKRRQKLQNRDSIRTLNVSKAK